MAHFKLINLGMGSISLRNLSAYFAELRKAKVFGKALAVNSKYFRTDFDFQFRPYRRDRSDKCSIFRDSVYVN